LLATHVHARGAADRVDYYEANTELASIAETFFGASFPEEDDAATDGVYLRPLRDVGKGDVAYAAVLLDRPELLQDKFKWTSLAKPLQRCGVVAVGMRGTVEEVSAAGRALLEMRPTLLPPKVLLVAGEGATDAAAAADAANGAADYVLLTVDGAAGGSAAMMDAAVRYVRTGGAAVGNTT